MSKQDRQGVRTAQDLERKYKYGNQEKLIKELRNTIAEAMKSIAEMKMDIKENTKTETEPNTETFTTTISLFLEPGEEEATTISNHVAEIERIPDDEIYLYDFNNNGTVTDVERRMVKQVISGLSSLASWSGAVKSDVIVTIDMSTPEKIVSAKGTNMWGREVELTASDLVADMLLDIDYLKSKSSEVSSGTTSTTISIFLEPGEEEATTISNHVAEIERIPDDEIYLYDFNNNGTVTDVERRMVKQVISGLSSLASWSGAVKSDVVVTIDMSTPEKIVSAKGTNMWGREVELTASELIADVLLDIDYLKSKSSETSSGTTSKTISIFLEPGEEEHAKVLEHVAAETYDELYDFNNDGVITAVDGRIAEQVVLGLRSLANWSGAVKSAVTVTIDMSTPEKIVSAKGTNMWGREVELTSTELFEYILKDVEQNKKKIEALRDEISSIEGGSYDDSDIKERLDTIEDELDLLKSGSSGDSNLSHKHVTESGTSGVWNYEKFSDSSIVCRKKFTPTASTFYDTGISDTYYRETTFKFPDGLLNAEPTHVLITPISESEYYPSVSVKSASAESIVVKTIMQTIDNSKSYKVGWYVEVVGTTDG